MLVAETSSGSNRFLLKRCLLRTDWSIFETASLPIAQQQEGCSVVGMPVRCVRHREQVSFGVAEAGSLRLTTANAGVKTRH